MDIWELADNIIYREDIWRRGEIKEYISMYTIMKWTILDTENANFHRLWSI